MRLRQHKDLVATSCHVETQPDLTSFITDLSQHHPDYGSPSTARFLVRSSMDCPDVVRKTDVEDGMSC